MFLDDTKTPMAPGQIANLLAQAKARTAAIEEIARSFPGPPSKREQRFIFGSSA
jgi:hypothetical protein